MGLEIRIAKTEEELKRVFKLRYKVYYEVGFTSENPEEILKDEFDKNSTNFYALRTEDREVVGAIRLIHDSKIGLPCEELFDVSFLRETGKEIAEVSARVTLDGYVKTNYKLIHAIIYYGKMIGKTYFVAIVNPDDIKFYNRFGMQQRGEIVYYEKVNMPAAFVYFDLKDVAEPHKTRFLTLQEDIILE